jgi:hypothetical protein
MRGARGGRPATCRVRGWNERLRRPEGDAKGKDARPPTLLARSDEVVSARLSSPRTCVTFVVLVTTTSQDGTLPRRFLDYESRRS